MKHLVRTWALALATMVAACGITDVEDLSEAVDLFVQSLDAEAFQASILSEPSQVEVVLLPGGLTASELAVRPSGASEEERVQSKAVAISGDAVGGRITLMLGELEVSFDADTRFWFGDHEVEMEGFLAEVRADIEAGHEPPIVAERLAPDTPQDPDDGSFRADAIAVTGDGVGRIRVEVDGDNLELVSDRQEGDPDGWLTVLGLRIQLRVTDGTTEIDSHEHDFEHVEDFEGLVSSVSVSDGIVRMGDGTTIRIVDRTHIKDRDGFIASLAGVAEVLAAGGEVVAWGAGAVETEEPPVLIGLEIAFKQRAEEEPHLEEFEGEVADAAPSEGTFTLGDGTVVRIVDGTEVVAHDDHSPNSLAGVVEALEAGQDVFAWGAAEIESEDPLVLEARRVVFKAVEVAEPTIEFEGTVVEVTEDAVVLDNGKTIVVGAETEVVAYHDLSPHDLAGVAEALERGRVIRAWGHGVVESEEPYVVAADRVVLRAIIEDFEADVVEIDVAAGVLFLEGGWQLIATADTQIAAADDGSPMTLDGAAQALEAGDRIRVWGWGFVTGEEPVTLELGELTIRRIVAG